MKKSTKKELFLLISLLAVFSILFLISFLNFKRNAPVFGLGISYVIEDLLIMALSLLSMIRIFWSIVKH